MGCDITVHAEKKASDGTYECMKYVSTFEERSYNIFAFLAGVRNYSAVTPISEPRGLPADVSGEAKERFEDEDWCAHTPSWLTIEELAEFDYGAMMEDRRVSGEISPNIWSGAHTAEPGGGAVMTYREFLGELFFKDLEKLKKAGADRIVFYFDD